MLWNLIHKNHPSIAAFCREHGITRAPDVSNLINHKLSPFKQNGQYRTLCVQLADIGRTYPEILFQEDDYEHLLHPKYRETENNFSDLPEWKLHRIMRSSGEERDRYETLLSHSDIQGDIQVQLSTLGVKERRIIEMRYGLGKYYGNALTPAEIAKLEKMPVHKVRTTEHKALRKLQHYTRAQHLRKYVYPEDGE